MSFRRDSGPDMGPWKAGRVAFLCVEIEWSLVCLDPIRHCEDAVQPGAVGMMEHLPDL